MATFTIAELRRDAGGNLIESGVKFEFTAKEHSIPVQPWEFSGLLRTHREDYPGYEVPTEQVLGPTYEDFTLSGQFDDKWMGGGSTGVAFSTMRALEALWRRGNPCHFSLADGGQTVEIVGILKHLKFSYRYATKIGYEFTVSPHFRKNQDDQATQKVVMAKASPTVNAQAIANKVVAARLLMAFAPASVMTGTTYTDVNDVVTDWEQRSETITQLAGSRSFSFDQSAPNSLSRLVQALEGMASAAMDVLDVVRPLTTDTALFYADSLAEAAFDAWARGMCVQGLDIYLEAHEAAADLRKRVQPNALAIYRPTAGESLYAISNRFYGTPSKWRDIYDRNALGYVDLTGTEILIIPGQQ